MSIALWITLGIIALWMGLRFLPAGIDQHRPLIELIALIDFLAAPVLAILTWSILIQAWPQSVLAMIELTLISVWRLAYRLPQPSLKTYKPQNQMLDTAVKANQTLHPPVITVMTLNCKYGHASAKAIVDQVERAGVDVLALQEVNTALLRALHKVGLRKSLPYLLEGPKTGKDNGGRNALFSRIKPVESRASSLDLAASAVPQIGLKLAGQTVYISSVHLKSPHRGAKEWGLGIEGLPKLAEPGPAIILGDCNANLHHPTFRTMLNRSKLQDASLSLRQGSHPTFPANHPFLPPMIEIDHILVSKSLIVKFLHPCTIPGTDHRGLIAGLAPDLQPQQKSEGETRSISVS